MTPGTHARNHRLATIAALLLVQFVLSPYVAAFLLFPRRPFLHAWTPSLVFRFVVDSAADLLYIVDICVRFRTYHFSSKGDLVLDNNAIVNATGLLYKGIQPEHNWYHYAT